VRVGDAIFEDPRLAEVYDAVDGDRSDLETYLALADELSVRSVLDVGCGTGAFACLLAASGMHVTAVDPAAASLEVARRKPHAHEVHWVEARASELPPVQVDLVTMTGNVAQVFLTDDEWTEVLCAARDALVPGGVLAFEVRRPERRAWEGWTKAATRRRIALDGRWLETWVEVTADAAPLVSFRHTFVFEPEGIAATSDSTLRFRTRQEVEHSLTVAGLELESVRDAPDRPGLEYVFVAKRAEGPPPRAPREADA
jgi:ubiquinone/menaquinone biosynthesis C-methylase UbiE